MIKNPNDMVQYMRQSEGREFLVQPNSIDLRLKEVFEIGDGLELYADGSRNLPEYERIKLREDNMFNFLRLGLYQVEFEESIEMPAGVCGITLLRSTMFKSGASGESGLFDSGYKGGVGMTISTEKLVRVEKGAPIAQMVFFEAEQGSLYNGYYQDGFEFKGRK